MHRIRECVKNLPEFALLNFNASIKKCSLHVLLPPIIHCSFNKNQAQSTSRFLENTLGQIRVIYFLFSDQAKKDLKKKEDSNAKLASDLKTAKHELSSQLKMTSTSETNSKKYLSALIDTQNMVSSLARTVTNALGDMATIKVEKVEPVSVKEESKPNGK